ncbi:MAG: peptidase C15 [Merismopedia sp. SIO2A8]|nr:peptidase C15 [Merismopedia sp. SIO2A8]
MPLPSLLLTSFSTWKPEQCSNSSDDLLLEIHQRFSQHETLRMLRQLPVDFQEAPARVIQAIKLQRPDAVICCGMGETRSHLCIEDRAAYNNQTRRTILNSIRLASGLRATRVSHDAGQFVCNRLYFDVLDYLQSHPQHRNCPCIFIHVPILTDFNREMIVADFLTILARMQLLADYQTAMPSPLPA